MKSFGIDIDKEKFADHLASKIEWFGDTLDDVFTEHNKYEACSKYRRIDHILSDFIVEGRRIVLLIQTGDFFIDDLRIYLPTMNLTIRAKLDNFFIIREVDHF